MQVDIVEHITLGIYTDFSKRVVTREEGVITEGCGFFSVFYTSSTGTFGEHVSRIELASVLFSSGTGTQFGNRSTRVFIHPAN